jgi:uncharacterized protein YjbJ (UPF0337 family)
MFILDVEGTGPMNWEGIESNWLQIKGLVRRHWAELSDADIIEVRGKRDALAQRLRDRYGISAVEADTEIEGWLKSLKSSRPT